MVSCLPAGKSDSSRDANIRTLNFYKSNVATLPAQGQDQIQFIPKIGDGLNFNPYSLNLRLFFLWHCAVMLEQPLPAFFCQAIPLQAAVGFIGNSHGNQPGNQGGA